MKAALWSIPEHKAPRADVYDSIFFKQAWAIIGDDVMDFFANGKLLKSVNSTLISLVANVDNAYGVQDFRPIACCTVL